MNTLQNWIQSLCGGAIFSALVLTITPRGRVHQVLRLVCGLMLALVLLSPLKELSWDGYAAYLAQYRQKAEATVEQAEEAADQYNRRIIEQECAAYIWDKAEQKGLTLESVSVACAWSEMGMWYPSAVTIVNPEGYVASLAAEIAGELGIPETMQKWS